MQGPKVVMKFSEGPKKLIKKFIGTKT